MKSGFVRLTPDRVSKRGTLWSNEPLGTTPEFSATLTFRISGQGKKLYGDGVGLWLTQFDRQQQGGLHGLDPEFVGVGVIIDTFKNAEHGESHRDVRIIVNDGAREYDLEASADPDGCNVDGGLRWHEGRDDFSVANVSRLRLLWKSDKLTVEVDAYSSNDWVPCGVVAGLKQKLPRDFLKKARFGITGTTGGVADNHDVVAFQVHDDHSEGKVASTAHHDEMYNTGDLERLTGELEHQLLAVTESLQNTIAKLQSQEDLIEERVKAIEESLTDGLQSRLEKRIGNLERQLDRKLQRQVTKSTGEIQGEMETLKISLEGVGADGSWKVPFFGLLVGMAGMGGAFWRHYNYLRKSHLL